MDETTTTSSGTELSAEAALLAGDNSQADDGGAKDGAEGSTKETHTDATSGDESNVDAGNTAEAEDDDAAWLRNKGIDPSDPDAIKKAAKLARDTEREFHASRQDKSKPNKSIQQGVSENQDVKALDEARGADPRLEMIERTQAEILFFQRHAEIAAAERASVEAEILAVAERYPRLASDFDLDTMYAIAKSERISTVERAAETRGRKAKAEEIERSSSAAIPDGNASSNAQAKEEADFLKGFNSKR